MKTLLSSDVEIPSTRADQRQATRARLLDAAVTLLIEQGSARTTTVAVQQRAGVSRGALLHHFPTHAELLCATVSELVHRNERAVQRARTALQNELDPTARAIRVLAKAMAQPAYLAELELWAVARTDAELHAALLAAERHVRGDFDRVVGELFAPLAGRPGCDAVVALSVEFLRGLALSGVLRSDAGRRRQLIAQWVQAATLLLDHPRDS